MNLPEDGQELNRLEAGPGLSFYIAGWLARYMGGDLQILWTEVGKGTCVELTLPSPDETLLTEEAALSSEFLEGDAGPGNAEAKEGGKAEEKCAPAGKGEAEERFCRSRDKDK